jgi:glycosyltransferase involved in cell wall biosynthesis
LASSAPMARVTASLVIPAYDEERGLEAVLESLAAAAIDGLEVIVVDDGSTDDTAKVAERYGARLVSHPANRGKGTAVQSGLAVVGAAKVVVMDADGTYPIAAIPRLLELLETNDHVRGIRRIGRKNIPALNRLGNALIRLSVRFAFRVRSADPLTGLYALRTVELRRMNLSSPGYGLETEIAIKSSRMRLRTVDHPIAYGARQGRSKLSPLRDGIVIARLILGQAWPRLRSRSKYPRAD